MTRRSGLIVASLALLATACAEAPSLPSDRAIPAPGGTAAVLTCSLSPQQIEALLTQAFSNSPDASAVLGKWSNIQHHVVNQQDLETGKQKVFDLVEFILRKHRQQPLTISSEDLATLINELFCFVGLSSGVSDPDNTWIVYPNDPLVTFVTGDGYSGIQFPASAVTENTLVTASQVAGGPNDFNPLNTLLDKYPFVYDWTLTPSQTLTPGTLATVGVCPSAASLASVPAADLADLLTRLVLGHQHSATDFDVLGRVPIPAAMTLTCGDTDAINSSVRASLGGRVLGALASVLLPEVAHAATMRIAIGGVGGSTSEFSAFGPVDPLLKATGGVGGSTSEFLRVEPLAGLVEVAAPPTTIDGTVGTQRNGAGLPSVMISTAQGTPIPDIGVAFSTGAPATSTPVGDASLCGSETVTDATGTARATCLDFGTTVQYRTAYTKLAAQLTVPDTLAGSDAQGNPIVTIDPAFQNWLLASYGPSTLAFTQPPAGRTVANSNPYTADENIPARVEIRSDLGDVVPLATNAVTLSLNQNTFVGGSNTAVANAVAGVATFAKQVPKAATGYTFGASASLSDIGPVNAAASNVFDVIAGAAAQISVVGTADYGIVTQAGNPVSPNPKVLVTDAQDNAKAGATVFWQAGGATGTQANGTASQSTTTSAGDGTTTATWLLGEGDNVLRASLQAAAGGAETFFTATLQTTYTTLNACAPGGGKDDILAHYFEIPGPSKNGGLIHSIGVYLSAAGAVGQIDETVGFPVTLKARRMVNGTPEVFSETVTAFLRGDNGSSSAADRLVTFNVDIPPAAVNGPQPKLTVWFEPPVGGYDRRINFNGGPCGLGKCRPPPGCDAIEYRLPIVTNNEVYRRSVGLMVKGQ